MCEEIVRAAVDRRRRDDVLAGMHERLERVRDRRRAGGNAERRDTALKRRNALRQDILRRVRQACVDIARVLERETICCVLRIVEDKRRRLVDRDGTRICRRIGGLLSYVELECLKMIGSLLAHGRFPFRNLIIMLSYRISMFRL